MAKIKVRYLTIEKSNSDRTSKFIKSTIDSISHYYDVFTSNKFIVEKFKVGTNFTELYIIRVDVNIEEKILEPYLKVLRDNNIDPIFILDNYNGQNKNTIYKLYASYGITSIDWGGMALFILDIGDLLDTVMEALEYSNVDIKENSTPPRIIEIYSPEDTFIKVDNKLVERVYNPENDLYTHRILVKDTIHFLNVINRDFYKCKMLMSQRMFNSLVIIWPQIEKIYDCRLDSISRECKLGIPNINGDFGFMVFNQSEIIDHFKNSYNINPADVIKDIHKFEPKILVMEVKKDDYIKIGNKILKPILSLDKYIINIRIDNDAELKELYNLYSCKGMIVKNEMHRVLVQVWDELFLNYQDNKVFTVGGYTLMFLPVNKI